MKHDDKKRFAQSWLGAYASVGQECPIETVDAAFGLLQGYPIDDVEGAIKAHMLDPERGRFAPRPADVVAQLQKSQERNPVHAWGLVMKALGTAGPYKRITFEDGLIHAALERLGWAALNNCTYDELTWKQKEFEKIYTDLPTGTQYPRWVSAIPCNDPEHICIGDREEANQTFRLGYDPEDNENRVSGPQSVAGLLN